MLTRQMTAGLSRKLCTLAKQMVNNGTDPLTTVEYHHGVSPVKSLLTVSSDEGKENGAKSPNQRSVEM